MAAQLPRYVISGVPHEISFRTRKGLPFPTWLLMKSILLSAMARTQRDLKVTICHFIWMSNHAHLIVIPKDADQLKKFHAELKKKVTDYTKALTGISSLSLWQGDSMVSPINRYEKLIERVAYLYSNPAKANFVKRIEEYTHLSSFSALKEANQVDYKLKIEVPWIRLPAIEKIPSNHLSKTQDKFLTEKLLKSSKQKHLLVIEPFAFLGSYGISPDEKDFQRIKKEALDHIRLHEDVALDTRIKENKKILGQERLFKAGIVWEYYPTKKQTRPCILASTKEERKAFINFLRGMQQYCKELYKLACKGVRVIWPEGMYPPPLIPTANCIFYPA